MTTAVQQLLECFDTLAAAERHQAAIEILRRAASVEGDVPASALVEAADELFRALDTEEAENAQSRPDLPQLVGLRCAVCQRTVPSIAHGVFCLVCGNPIHLECRQPDGTSITDGRCSACGGDANSFVAVEVRAARNHVESSKADRI